MVQESFPRVARLRHGSQGTNYSRLSWALIIDIPRRQVSSEVQSDLWPNIAVISLAAPRFNKGIEQSEEVISTCCCFF